MKTYATASRDNLSIHNQIEAVVVDVMTYPKLGFTDTNSGDIDNVYKYLKSAVDSF